MTISMVVTGIKKVTNYLNKKLGKTKKNVKEGIKSASIFMQGKVKKSIAGREAEPTSVDTGNFLNSIDWDINGYEGVVFTRVKYAKFLEFGTVYISPRRHFRNTKSRNKHKIQEKIEEEVNNI